MSIGTPLWRARAYLSAVAEQIQLLEPGETRTLLNEAYRAFDAMLEHLEQKPLPEREPTDY